MVVDVMGSSMIFQRCLPTLSIMINQYISIT